MVLSKYVVSSSPHLIQGEKKVILYSLLTNKLVLCNYDDYIAFKHNCTNDYFFVRELEELGMAIDYSEKDNSKVCAENIEKSKGFPLLRIQIQPTYDCQLACSYCGQKHRNLYMNRRVEEGILIHLERILSSGSYKGLSVGWFGGEPTMSEESMFRMTEEFRILCKKMGLSYQAKLCTNGYQLSDRLVNCIKELCLSEIQITLDGPSFINDRIKPTVNGEGSYYRIMENMSRLIDIGANVRLRCNVNKENCNYVKQLIDLLCENKIEKEILFYIRSVYYWGQNDMKHMLSSTEFARLEIVIFRYMLHKGMKLNLLPKRVYRTCFAQDKDSFLVDPLGRLFNCDEVTPVPAYENMMKNRFQIGCVESGIDEDKRKVIGNFHERILLGDYPCLYCKMYPVCAGLCHLRWLEGHQPCPSYKYNIKERLDLYYEYVHSKDFA